MVNSGSKKQNDSADLAAQDGKDLAKSYPAEEQEEMEELMGNPG